MGDRRQNNKVFVGGLSWETTDERLRTYFENYGVVSEAFVSVDRNTGRPRGFGFVVFDDPSVADKVVKVQHTIDRREVEAKKAVPKEDHPNGRQANGLAAQRTKKIFVGGLAPTVDESAFKRYFEQYGEVEDAVVMYDHENKRPRGFGFVTFATEEGVDQVFTQGALQTLHDKPIEIKKAVPRDQINSARGRTSFGPQSSPRLGGSSGFAAAANLPAFGEGSSLGNSLLQSHSLQTPSNVQRIQQHLTGAASLGGANQLPVLNHTSFTQGLINAAMSGQLNGQLSGLNSQLSLPNGTSNGLQQYASGQLANLAHANSANLQSLGSAQLAGGLGQGSFSLGNGLPNGLAHALSGNLTDLNQNDVLGAGYNTAALQRHLSQQANDSAFNHTASNAYANGGFPSSTAFANNQTAFTNGNGVTKSSFSRSGTSGLEDALGGLKIDHQPSVELPPSANFEDRVTMLSAGSAGLGQLPSPNATYGLSPYQDNNDLMNRHVTHELQ